VGLFGESTEELARKEIEAKRKYSAKHGVEVNANISDMKIGDNIAKQSKPKLNFYQKTVFVTGSIFAIIFLVIFCSIIYTDLTRPKPDYEGFNSQINTYLSQIKNVVSYRMSESGDDIYYVTVNKSSWAGLKIDKVTYCTNIRQTFTAYGWKYNIISKNEMIDVIFETEDGVRLAKPDGIEISDYKIYY
jgi:hypothetical protein